MVAQRRTARWFPPCPAHAVAVATSPSTSADGGLPCAPHRGRPRPADRSRPGGPAPAHAAPAYRLLSRRPRGGVGAARAAPAGRAPPVSLPTARAPTSPPRSASSAQSGRPTPTGRSATGSRREPRTTPPASGWAGRSRCARPACCAGAPPSPTAPDTPCTVDAVNPVLPVPPEAAELLDSTGRRMRERTPQRTPFTRGVWVREGRTGYDSAYLLAAVSTGFGARLGRGFGRAPGRATTAAPPNAPSTPGSRRRASASRCSRQGALEPGAASTPSWQYASHSDAGPHPPHLRGRGNHPASPRPVVNTWTGCASRPTPPPWSG
ncbi:glycoside hydrolase family 36 N-terminal domain-containing protein [Streptomonospora halophila]|uniref:glycoside hydrolase family 36 N-terminal domain-containing protein n=1 Tax=Streptomonospora halophila TaxID=427369 RepID=UPI003CD075FB